MMAPAEIAEIGFSGLQSGKTIVVPVLVNKMPAVSVRLFPRRLVAASTAYINN